MTSTRGRLVSLLGLGLGVGSILAFRAVGDAFYRGFLVPQGFSMNHLPPEELAFIALFAVWGGLAVVGLTLAVADTSLPGTLRALYARLTASPWPSVVVLAGLVFGASAWIATAVLGGAVISDDEHTYRLIARTLETGALVAPPTGDPEFFAEQFVVQGPRGRYGKYPIGYPLLLAAGRLADVEPLVVPLLTALLVPLTFVAARALVDSRTAVLAAVLVACSPQVLATGATWLSQPASAVCLMAAVAALAVWGRSGAGPGLLAAASAALAYGVIVRPLPAVLFAAAAIGWVAWRLRAAPRARAVASLAALVGPLLLAAAVLLVCNRAQSGSFWTSGYQAFHRPGEVGSASVTHLGGDFASLAMSLVGSLLRLDVWLFGWPVSLVLAVLGRHIPGGGLLWSMVGAAVAYRVISPKVGVGGVGPLYFFEVVPVLCILSAHGLVKVVRHARGARYGIPTAAAATVVALSMFAPPRIADLRRMGQAQNLLPRLLAARGIHRALVFHQGVAPPSTGLTWAYFPRCNGPALDDDVLFVRLREADRNLEFWQRRFPDRSAWVFLFDPREGPRLMDLREYAAS